MLMMLAIVASYSLKAQNIYPYKLTNCETSQFCLDCGDQKAGVKSPEFETLVADLNKAGGFSGVAGKVLFQVLVDSVGHGCVLSHTDKSNSKLVQSIVAQLNAFTSWIPAKTGNKTEGRTSMSLIVEIKDGILSAQVQRVDMKAFRQSFDRPLDPIIFNKSYQYSNEHLKDYAIQVWNAKNSNLPDNFIDYLTVDKDNAIWISVDQSLVKFNGAAFTPKEQDITPKGKYFSYSAVACDNDNMIWVVAKGGIYSYSNERWALMDTLKIGFKGAYKIINNKASGEVYFCSDSGLGIFKAGNWSFLNQANVAQLPSNRVYFAKKDAQGRLWVGTFGGSVMIDENGKATSFNTTNTVLKGKCITSMDEDENGNIYLGLYEYGPKDKKELNRDEGIAVYHPDGSIKQYTTANSGMPFNGTSTLLYDRTEKVLWIATDKAGLVRWDLKNGWENYHNQNSAIPTSYVSNMAFDNNGVLYLTTRQGLVRVQRK